MRSCHNWILLHVHGVCHSQYSCLSTVFEQRIPQVTGPATTAVHDVVCASTHFRYHYLYHSPAEAYRALLTLSCRKIGSYFGHKWKPCTAGNSSLSSRRSCRGQSVVSRLHNLVSLIHLYPFKIVLTQQIVRTNF